VIPASFLVAALRLPLSVPLQSPESRGLFRSSQTFVIAGLDPAIHAVTVPQPEASIGGWGTAWMPWSGHGMTEETGNWTFGQRAAGSLPGAAGRPHIGQHTPKNSASCCPLKFPRHCRARPCNPCPDRASTGSLNWRMGNGVDAMVGPWHDGGNGELDVWTACCGQSSGRSGASAHRAAPPTSSCLSQPPPSLQGSTLQSMP
jgi:hypothetical protein